MGERDEVMHQLAKIQSDRQEAILNSQELNSKFENTNMEVSLNHTCTYIHVGPLNFERTRFGSVTRVLMVQIQFRRRPFRWYAQIPNLEQAYFGKTI